MSEWSRIHKWPAEWKDDVETWVTMDEAEAKLRAENKLREIAQGCLTRASGALTAEQMVWFEPLEEALAQEESE